MVAYLHHVTLTTGHSRRSYRSEAGDDSVAYAAGLIAQARRAGRADLPSGLAHHGLTVAAEGHALIATIDAPSGPHEAGRPYRGKTMPLVTLAVPRKSRVAPALWETLCGNVKLDRIPDRPPSPWLAVYLHPTLGGYPGATGWLGDLGRLIAWAWIEGKEDNDG